MKRGASLLAGFVVLGAAGAGVYVASGPRESGLPVVGPAGPYQFTERSGRAITDRDLAGRVWISDFIFTHCAGPCPMMTTRMSILQNTLPAEVRYVSFAVDPDRDTLEKLRSYAEAYGADPARWYFVRGPWEDVIATVDRFHLTVRKETDPKPGFEIVHDLRFALVDRAGRIRGYYVGTDETELKKLEADARRLLASGE